ncbi:AI-2E family transporter [Variovorax sp. RTB1]|uniref:AI-2E family transporter n=1 Tax=Variovorax sp. RTB1 TaxID=3048631 RepID=UPI002B22AF7E|nr:AI-2E family transporter [Variovorax sp. RTB1]MEB0113762.1 AI-2E family transporter [Variovorax sp. RTB1]
MPNLKNFQFGLIVPATCVLLLLHFGQDFLKPIVIAGVLSLVLAPLVRRLAVAGLGRTVATLVSVVLAAACVAWISAVLAIQLVAVAGDLPQYTAAISGKVDAIREFTVRPFERIESELKGMLPQAAPPEATAPRRQGSRATVVAPPPAPAVQAPQSAGERVTKLLSTLWGPVGQAGIVFVLLVFILLEHESLSDRFIRLVGEAELGTTVQALSAAAQGVSRFFLSQSIVNAIFGTVVGVGLWAIGLPHAALWGCVAALLRFIPYVGVLGAAALIAVFAAAVDPGWTLVLASLGFFGVLELVFANVLEPQVYGHSTGLAPLAVIVSALFWGALWGPVGLLLSTPLTLCLVVMGRHVKALAPFTILLSDAPGLSAGQRFYQRALSGNASVNLQEARAFLRRSSFARYCDHVLFPGLALGAADFRIGRIDQQQRERILANIVALAESLSREQPARRTARRRAPTSLVDANMGAHLRHMREARLGRWQGRLDVPSRSIVLCMGFGTDRDDLLMELLVRALREEGVDARSVSTNEPQDPETADKASLVGTVFLVYPRQDGLAQWRQKAAELRAALPDAILATIKLALDDSSVEEKQVEDLIDLVLHSYSEAEAFVLESKQKTDAASVE